jgi:copper(I)-binding protein
MTILAWRGSQAAGPVSRLSGGALLLLYAFIGALAAGPAAWAEEPGLTVSDPWLRLVLPSRPAAGYLTLANGTDKPLVLVGAASPGCGSIMLHRSVQENGQERMEMVESVAIPAHGEVQFAPGGYHLMCMTPAQDMTPGRSVPVTLRFADGGTVIASFPVRGATGK